MTLLLLRLRNKGHNDDAWELLEEPNGSWHPPELRSQKVVTVLDQNDPNWCLYDWNGVRSTVIAGTLQRRPRWLK